MSGADFFAAKAQLIMDNLPKSSSGRIRRGTLRKIARATKGLVSETYLWHLANEHIAEPSWDKLEALSQALGIPTDWWSLPVEAGPPPAGARGKEMRSFMARVISLPPERQDEALERIQQVLAEIEED
jgi:transcriptional regulator with XRE-family HTH domain